LLWWVFSKKPLYAFFLMTLIYCAISVFDFPLFMGSVMQVRYLIVIFICIHFFFIGVVFGRVYDRWKPPKRLMSGAYLLFLPLFPVIYCHIFSASFDNANNMWMDFGIFFCMGLIFFLILFFVPDNNVLLSNKIGDFLGKISYSLYLLHIPTIRAVYTFLPARKSPVYFLVCLALAILISTASYLMVEKLTRDAIRAYFDVGRSSPKEAKGRKRSSARSMPALNEQKH
jgi:peptidoglycan/LPS O-acetylase OafA/YrhL